MLLKETEKYVIIGMFCKYRFGILPSWRCGRKSVHSLSVDKLEPPLWTRLTLCFKHLFERLFKMSPIGNAADCEMRDAIRFLNAKSGK